MVVAGTERSEVRAEEGGLAGLMTFYLTIEACLQRQAKLRSTDHQ
jgi:hypothetical protein